MTDSNRIYLSDYQAPDFGIKTVNLDIKLYDDHAIVDTVLNMYQQNSIDSESEIILFGRNLELLSLQVAGVALSEGDYQLDNEQLIITSMPNGDALPVDAEVITQVKIIPQKNTSLEGLYMAGDGNIQTLENGKSEYEKNTMFVTQCEAEGFRKITFFPDRPDVLAEYTTRVEADKKFPTLLSNGHLIDSGDVQGDAEGNRHFAIWHDPAKKPSYLFACVIADLQVMQDTFTTSENREVLLEIYTKSDDIDKCDVAMQALKDSMKWDEDNYGRAYDLNRFMIVAVSQFNMGAMENKGLNIFNTACVLSTPETTTDPRTFSVKAIIAHEYFHNWTGNRITCRDWFQLCLKEGLTVFRDQSFSADHQSPAVQRIEDVGILRAAQFSEDAGALSHPVRPESFVEINNFYTATVYEKGAEICRMLANMMGADNYRRGTDEYFRRYDGQAVTVEDWLSALSSIDERASDFITWYRQPATPRVSVEKSFDKEKNCYTLRLSQKTRHVSGYDAPVALPIPVATALFDRNTGKIIAEEILMLTEDTQEFVFDNLNIKSVETETQVEPIVSLLRDFSAPINLNVNQTSEELAFLLENETNGFNRWQSAQSLVNLALQNDAHLAVYLDAIQKSIKSLVNSDPMLAARLLDIPAERELAVLINENYNPQAVKTMRDNLVQKLAKHMQSDWIEIYQQLPIVAYEDSPHAKGVRALRNAVLSMAMVADKFNETRFATNCAKQQYDTAVCMTERLGALSAMLNNQIDDVNHYLADYFKRFENNELVIDMWFGAQAGALHISIEQINTLINHDRFDLGTPNRVNSVMRNFANCPVLLWSETGLTTYLQVVQKLDESNPSLASRLLQPMARWHTLIAELKAVANDKLIALRANVSSKNVTETLDSILSMTK